jgi:hypothetical protein
MRRAMRTPQPRLRSAIAFLALAAALCAGGMACCPASDDAPRGGRLAHPPQPGPSCAASADSGQDAGRPAPKEVFTALDAAIADDCLSLYPPDAGPATLSRVWSKSVPERACTTDSVCGDGFCDRGQCAPIWSCGERYGQRCINGRTMRRPHILDQLCWGVCIEGRCRSCISDEECIQETGFSDARCVESNYTRNGQGRDCRRFGIPITANRPIP